jgi:hypothetical protein
MNQVDSLLIAEGVDFLRFVDNYYMFADSPAGAFKNLVTLTRILIENQTASTSEIKNKNHDGCGVCSDQPIGT